MPKKMFYTYHQDGTLPMPGSDEIFVFGSNERGIHGKGAALVAKDLYQAQTSLYAGLTSSRSYAIPTKDRFIQTLPLFIIKRYIAIFIAFTLDNPNKKFFITRVGCGLAGYKDSDIAPLFKGSSQNCSFPVQWRRWLQ